MAAPDSKRPKQASRRVGVVGYGALGKFLVNAILAEGSGLELAFVWNRTPAAVTEDARVASFLLEDLREAGKRSPDLIVEVAHPCITEEHGEYFLSVADYMVGSPTVFADATVESKCRAAALIHGLYVPSGALWGAVDIQKMADRGTLTACCITMEKHPSSLKLCEPLKSKNDAIALDSSEDVVIYDGSVRGLCPLAPNNVNTMACAALAAHNLGFDKVQGRLVANASLEAHVITIDVTGPVKADGESFRVKTVRHNPAKVGAVTGSATYVSFVSSMQRAKHFGPGLHFC